MRVVAAKNNYGNSSLFVNVGFHSTDGFVSPIVDKDRMSTVLINNRINNPDATDIVYAEETGNIGTAEFKYLHRPVELLVWLF